MLQRNPGPYTIDLPTLSPPVRLLAGEEIDHPTLLAGLEEVESKDDKSTKPARESTKRTGDRPTATEEA